MIEEGKSSPQLFEMIKPTNRKIGAVMEKRGELVCRFHFRFVAFIVALSLSGCGGVFLRIVSAFSIRVRLAGVR